MLAPSLVHFADSEQEINSFSASDVVEHAQSQIDREIDALEVAIRTLKRRRNAVSLVFRLPPEILGRIFEATRSIMSAKKSLKYRLSWIAVSHVCCHWRDVAIDCLHLWTYVDSRCLEWAEEMLRRSRSMPLTVSLDLRTEEKNTIQPFWDHLPRIQKLHLIGDFNYLYNWIGLMLSTSPSLLKTFSVTFPCLEKLEEPNHATFFLDIPPLHHLELKNCPVSWQWPHFKELVSLRLSFDADVSDSQPSASQLIAILSDMPRLKLLHLEHVIPEVFASDVDPSPKRRILLPQLQCLSIVSDIRSCSGVLNHLIFPHLTLLELKLMIEEGTNLTDEFLSICPTLSYWSDSDRPGAPAPISHLTCHYHGEGIIFSATDDRSVPEVCAAKSQLKLEFLTTDWNLTKLVRPVCESLPLRDLEVLHATYLKLPKSAWLNSFGRLPRLANICVTNDCDGGFIRALSTEKPFASTAQKTPPLLYFPALQYLKIVGWDFDDPSKETTCIERFENCLRTRRKLQSGIQALYLSECVNLLGDMVKSLETIVPRVHWDDTTLFSTDSEDQEDYEDFYEYSDEDLSEWSDED